MEVIFRALSRPLFSTWMSLRPMRRERRFLVVGLVIPKRLVMSLKQASLFVTFLSLMNLSTCSSCSDSSTARLLFLREVSFQQREARPAHVVVLSRPVEVVHSKIREKLSSPTHIEARVGEARE